MPTRLVTVLWAALALVGTTGAFCATSPLVSDEFWRRALAATMAIGTLVCLFPIPSLRHVATAPLRGLRRRPIRLWLLALVVPGAVLGRWVAIYQPAHGRFLTRAELTYLCFVPWALLYLAAYARPARPPRVIAAALGRSQLTGALISLTTIALLFAAAETYLRVFGVATDAYSFTAMNRQWYLNFYWPTLNSLGFRDHEPKPDPDGRLLKIAVLGDSFVVGHGIDDFDQTFPQLLERRLGERADVLVVAKPGWDTDVELAELQKYPVAPNVVILSYYLNDISYLTKATALDPDRNFRFPQQPLLGAFVRNFFVPNYVYFNLLQFTAPRRTRGFIQDLVDAHRADALWSQHARQLQAIVDWTRARGIRLLVMVWPHLLAIDDSRPATARVAQFFQAQGVPVVDLCDLLKSADGARLVVNRFDAHPGVVAQRRAADALYAALTKPHTPNPEH